MDIDICWNDQGRRLYCLSAYTHTPTAERTSSAHGCEASIRGHLTFSTHFNVHNITIMYSISKVKWLVSNVSMQGGQK